MAGGAGERFWPLSNRRTPKQLLRLSGEKTLLRRAFDRAAGFVGGDRVFIVAGERLREAIEGEVPGLLTSNYIAEPMARNTAACLGLAAVQIRNVLGPKVVMGVMTADHEIEDGPEFTTVVEAGFAHADSHDDLVTLGIRPTRAETGFGYLELGEALEAESASQPPIRRVVRFTEKPDAATAENFLNSGRHCWNSGMFFWRVETLLKALAEHCPEIYEPLARISKGTNGTESKSDIRAAFEAMPSIPIDVAVMEKAKNVVAVEGNFGWADLGSWNSLSAMVGACESGNSSIGEVIMLDSRNNVVYNTPNRSGESDMPTVVMHGVEEMIVVRTGQAILITPKSRAQDVKGIVKALVEMGREDLL